MPKGLLGIMGETAHLRAELARVTAELEVVKAELNDAERKNAAYGMQIMQQDNLMDKAILDSSKAIVASSRRRTIPLDEIVALMEEIGATREGMLYSERVKNPNTTESRTQALQIVSEWIADVRSFDETTNVKAFLKENDVYKIMDSVRKEIMSDPEKESTARKVEIYELMSKTAMDAWEAKYKEGWSGGT